MTRLTNLDERNFVLVNWNEYFSNKVQDQKEAQALMFENWKVVASHITKNDPEKIKRFVDTMSALDEALSIVPRIDLQSIGHLIKNSMNRAGKDFHHVLPICITLLILVNHVQRVVDGIGFHRGDQFFPNDIASVDKLQDDIRTFIKTNSNGVSGKGQPSFVSNSNETLIDEHRPPTNLTHILKLYYEKGCKELKRQQVETLAAEKSLSATSLIKIWQRSKTDYYRPKAYRQSAREFLRSYELLMKSFGGINENAFTAVKNHYDQLKKTYPDLTY